MENSNTKNLTLEEAKQHLAACLMQLATISINQKHIISYVEQLEAFIAQQEANAEKATETHDETE